MRLLVAKTFPKGIYVVLLSCLCNLFNLLSDRGLSRFFVGFHLECMHAFRSQTFI